MSLYLQVMYTETNKFSQSTSHDIGVFDNQKMIERRNIHQSEL